MNKSILAYAIALTAACNVGAAASARVVTLLDKDWQFTLQTDSAAGVTGCSKMIDLPHDWSVESAFIRNAPCGNDGGYLPGGRARYTKQIDLGQKQLEDKTYYLLFEGVYERWTCHVNGDSVGFRPYGYSSVIYDVTPYLKPGKNTIEVDVDNSHHKNCRWYSGSGIYRHVKLLSANQTHITPWSVFITTPRCQEAAVEFDITGAANTGPVHAEIAIVDSYGNKAAEKSVHPQGNRVNTKLSVDSPSLWSPDTPVMYTAEITLRDSNGNELDHVSQPFGFREIEFSAAEGFRLNGEPMNLNGACVHHDNGMLGAAAYDAAEARKVRLLKEAGFNAVRTSHNPPAPAFLDECDRQGVLVIDEAFDGWREKKNDCDYHLWIDQWGATDMADLVRRDRNHPSVIAWSIGNEVMERKKIEIISTARRLAEICRALDPTRPVTEALCSWDSDWEIFDPHAEVLDIVGYNYMIHKSESDNERCPGRVMWQTESYPRDAAENSHKVKDHPYVIGDFVWTGIDYLGESGIGRCFYEGQTEGEHFERDQWPWHGAYCGDIDITGWRKPISYHRDMLHNGDRAIHMAVREPDGYHGKIKQTTWSVWPTWESWNWSGHEGKPIEVEIVSRYPEVRLYLNDVMMGEQPAGEANDYMAVFTLPYQPGCLKAVSVDAYGYECESYVIETAGQPAALRVAADKDNLIKDGQDLAFVTVEVVDSEGRVVPDAEVALTFEVTGGAELKACGNADLTATDTYADNKTTTWKGRALGIVKSNNTSGKSTIKVKSPGMRGATLTLK